MTSRISILINYMNLQMLNKFKTQLGIITGVVISLKKIFWKLTVLIAVKFLKVNFKNTYQII